MGLRVKFAAVEGLLMMVIMFVYYDSAQVCPLLRNLLKCLLHVAVAVEPLRDYLEECLGHVSLIHNRVFGASRR